MVVVMTAGASEADIESVCDKVRGVGGEAFVSRGAVHTVIGLVGDTERFEVIPFTQLPGVDHVIRIGKPYKMVSADLHPTPSTVKVGQTPVGRDSFTLIAGPCAVESYEQAMSATQAAKAAGATILRGDVFKPRTSPYSFQGLGEQGLEILAECRSETGLPIVDRGRRRLPRPARRRGRGLHPRRHAQRAELRAAEGMRHDGQTGHVEARPRDDDRRVAPGGRIRGAARQFRRRSCASGASARSSPRRGTRSTSRAWRSPSTSRICP